ncbi:MAG: purine-nucleoside phosphorylase [Azospirillum sp. 51_20]|nr:MAG: purine-nucleoside phosphorylase [Azospirillum sp. 51_20]
MPLRNFSMINTEQFKRLLADKRPQTAVILGSGLGSVADAVEDPLTIDYAAIEGFPRTTVAGHSGKMIVGRLGQSEVLCLQGRFHLYEGHRPQVIAEVVNALKAVGVNRLIVTNAAGSLNPEFTPGSLMLIKDHINFSGQNPLVGANDESTGPRFPDMSNAYDRDMRRQAKELAAKLGINLPEGVYLMVLGPNFETAAEIRAFRTLGADAVGMSTVPEVIAAVHAGIKVLAVSAVTNFGTGLQETPLSHEETIAGAARASSALTALITNYIKEFCHE